MDQPVYIVYGFYIAQRGDEIEPDSVAVFKDYDSAMSHGVKMIDRYQVSDYQIIETEVL